MDWHIELKTVLKVIHPELQITKEASRFLSSILGQILSDINNKLETLPHSTVDELNEIIENTLAGSGQVIIHAHIEGQKGFEGNPKKTFDSKKIVIKTENHQSKEYITAVLEYLSAEVLELGGNAARDNRKVKITPMFMYIAIDSDDELRNLFTKYGLLDYIPTPAEIKTFNVYWMAHFMKVSFEPSRNRKKAEVMKLYENWYHTQRNV